MSDIAILLFDGITALDAIGPYEVLSRVPDARVHFVGAQRGEVRTDNRVLGLVADESLDDMTSADVLLVPGGFGTRALLDDSQHLDWVRAVHKTTTWTTSVCTGSLVLAAAGLLDGIDATTHWAATGTLAKLGARLVQERVVERGRIITCAGVSAGIDMALVLAARLSDDVTAQAIQLAIEYDPQPPYASGSAATATPEVMARAAEITQRSSRIPAPDNRN